MSDIKLPDGSIYFWMYTQGLHHVDRDAITSACHAAGVAIRDKDWDNYWRGFYHGSEVFNKPNILFGSRPLSKQVNLQPYSDYPVHPMVGLPNPEERYVPCNQNNKPMIKWGQGCMELGQTIGVIGCRFLAENLKGCKFIVIDCDGDHDKEHIDLETIEFLTQFQTTHTLSAPRWIDVVKSDTDYGRLCPSFHLTYTVDRVIPTMHFPKAHIDIIGNKMNSLRYFKNKIWNQKEALPMTDEIWDQLRAYIERRNNENQNN